MDQVTSRELNNEYGIIYLIYHRSKNQHRSQVWFKYLNIIVRKLRRILKLQIDIDRINNQKRIEYKSNQITELANYLIRKVFNNAYWAFNSILALGQFINLGFTLIGSLSKLYELLIKIPNVEKQQLKLPKITDQKIDKEGNRNVGIGQEVIDDIGEEVVIEEVANSDISGFEKKRKANDSIDDIFASNKKDKKSDKKNKRKKKKSAIDDIFK